MIGDLGSSVAPKMVYMWRAQIWGSSLTRLTPLELQTPSVLGNISPLRGLHLEAPPSPAASSKRSGTTPPWCMPIGLPHSGSGVGMVASWMVWGNIRLATKQKRQI